MGEVLQKRWVGQQATFEVAEFSTLPHDYGRWGAYYEQLLAQDFSQTAYLVKDLLEHGKFRPETDQRVGNELAGLALEKLGKPFLTEFTYRNSANGLVAEDGELFREMNERGLQAALEDAEHDPRLNFLVNRRRADVAFVSYIENQLPIGATAIVASACPSPTELGVPEQLIEDANYQPSLDQAMVWVVSKTAGGVQYQTISLFHADPGALAETIAAATNQPVAVCDREASPWQQTTISTGDGTTAERIITAFDTHMSQKRGEETLHGLTQAERQSTLQKTAEHLVHEPQFIAAQHAAQDILRSVAESIVSGALAVPDPYLEKILSMRRPDGTFELTGKKRSAVMKLRNSAGNQTEFIDALQVVHTSACAGLWGTIAHLYYGDNSSTQPEVYAAGDTASIAINGLTYVEESRSAGRTELGCPGDNRATKSGQSIFEMNNGEVLNQLFGRKVIRTSCPKCDEEDVKAVIEHGTITCKSCQACVELCTGKTLRRPRVSKRLKKIGKKATGWLASKSTKAKKKQKKE